MQLKSISLYSKEQHVNTQNFQKMCVQQLSAISFGYFLQFRCVQFMFLQTLQTFKLQHYFTLNITIKYTQIIMMKK